MVICLLWCMEKRSGPLTTDVFFFYIFFYCPQPLLNTAEDTQLLTDGKAEDSGEDDDLLAL